MSKIVATTILKHSADFQEFYHICTFSLKSRVKTQKT